jgi:hypothetical protein
MQPDVARDFRWQRRFIPALKAIMAEYLIGEAPIEDDRERATDLLVLRLEAVRVACRVRRNDQLRYAHEFTIRRSRSSGSQTELRKVLRGYGDYMIYGFSNEAEDGLAAWLLGDLNVFREWFATAMFRLPAGQLPGVRKANRDGATDFQVFRLAELPPEFVVAREMPDLQAAAA